MAQIKSTITVKDSIETPSPIILTNGNWGLWDHTAGKFVDSGMPARGPQGIRGLDGTNGTDGTPGAPGKDGRTSYTHIAYADNASGGGFSQNPTAKAYIGMYVDFTEADSSDPSKYAWSLIRGEQGERGVEGKAGADGRTPYLHIAYATSADGRQGFSVSDSKEKTYIGTYTDYTRDDSTSPSSYNWSRIKGDKGDTGVKGDQGVKGDDAIALLVTSTGEFVQRVHAHDSQGSPLTTPRKEPIVKGGVRTSDGKTVLRLRAQVIKGGVDVTQSAISRGGGLIWTYKGSQIAKGVATVDLDPAKYADGKEDLFECAIDTSRASEW